MALREILKYPHPFLKTKAQPISAIDQTIAGIIGDMVETMYHAKGIGLAATQIGIGLRLAVLDVPKETDVKDGEDNPEKGENLLVIINPEIIEATGSNKYEEGCLSIPGITANVQRPSAVKVAYIDEHGHSCTIEADGLLATALQHEIDHLDGIVFIDRLSRLKRELIIRKIKKSLEQERAL